MMILILREGVGEYLVSSKMGKLRIMEILKKRVMGCTDKYFVSKIELVLLVTII